MARLPMHREKRHVTTGDYKMSDHYGMSLVMGNAGLAVNDNTASNVSAVTACVKIKANMLSVLPLKLMRSTATGSEVVTDHPSAVVIRQPGDLHTGGELRALMETGRGYGGNGYCRVHRMGGKPVELEWIAPCDVDPYRPTGTRMIAYRVTGIREPLTRYDLIHVRGISLDGIRGVSPIRQLANAIGTSLSQSQAAGNLMRNGTAFPGYLTSPESLSAEKLSDARKEWDSKYSGAANTGRVPILWGGWEFRQTNGMSMVDAQFLESRRFELEEIARYYGVPSFMINDTTKTTSWGSGMQEIIETWLKVSLDADLVHWEDSVSYTLLTVDEIRAGLHFKFNRRKLLEQSPEKQAAFLTAMRSIGAYSVNDVRRKVDENDLTDELGNDYTLPFNNTGGAAVAKAEAKEPEIEPIEPNENET